MILAKDSRLAGHPVRVVQTALQDIHRRGIRSREGFVDREKRRAHLRSKSDVKAMGQTAGELWDSLVAEGLLVRDPRARPGAEAFQVSQKALSVLNAHIGKGYTRRSATQALNGFLE